ncbi:MAG: tryptophan synthase subunit alpha [Zoogloeaceae bacterium]|jgi:tryptophan synthase alpha chain|nr:tryptophan synthase subunit alpha [Zoogloeaceae bacterium]
MSRIQTTFQRLQEQRRKALIPFLTAGFPRPELTVSLMHTLVKSGADLLELGIPFSDPMADGPTIQRASEAALRHGMSLKKALALVKQFRETDTVTPIVLMGYANPIEAMGQEAFAHAAAEAGVDGILTVDYALEESSEFAALLEKFGLDAIFLLAPTSSHERWAQLQTLARGYVYYVSLKGVTGAGGLDLAEVAARVTAIRATLNLPVGVGFGIRDAETAAILARHADAIIVGSRLIEELEHAPVGEELARIAALTLELRRGLDSVQPAPSHNPERG